MEKILEKIVKGLSLLAWIAIFNIAIPVFPMSVDFQYMSATEPEGGDECDFAVGYDFGYNGDQASGDTYGCLSGTPTNGTESAGGIVTANGRTGNGVEVNAADQYLSFSTTQSWSAAFIRLDFKTSNVGTATSSLFDAYYDDNNRLFIYIIDGNMYYRWTGNGVNVTGAIGHVVTVDTWVTLEFEVDTTNSFNGGTAGLRYRIDFNGDGDFDDTNEEYHYESDIDDVTAMSNNPTYFDFGERHQNQFSGTVTTYIDNGFISW